MRNAADTPAVSRRLKHALRALVAGAALLTIALPAHEATAQIVTISDATVTSPTLSGNATAEIDRFIDRYRPDLVSDDYEPVGRAVDAIAEQTRRRGVSVAFRTYVGTSLQPTIRELLDAGADAPIWKRFVAIRLASLVATEPMVSIVDRQLDDEDPAVQRFAISGTETIFRALATETPAINERTARRLTERLGELIRSADDPILTDGAIKALERASRVSNDQVEGLRFAALSTIANATGDRIQEADAFEADAVLHQAATRAGLVLRNAIVAPGSGTPTETRIAAVRLGADLAHYTARRVAEAGIDAINDGTDEYQLAVLAENLIQLGASGVPGADIPRPEIARYLEANNRAQFSAGLLNLIGPGGALTRAPFDFDPARFTLDR